MRFLSKAFYCFLLLSCKGKNNIPTYSGYEPIGNTHLTVTIDSKPAYKDIVDNSIYLEISTKKNTFFVKPYDYKLSFPILHDSITKISFYYNNFKFVAIGNNIYKYKRFFYFPKIDTANLIISKLPFKQGISEQGNYHTKNQIFTMIQLDKTTTLFATLSQDTVKSKR